MSHSNSLKNEARRFFVFSAIVVGVFLGLCMIPFIGAYLHAVPNNRAAAIDVGMRKDEVIQIIGIPHQKEGAYWLYSVRGCSDLLQIRFRDGKVYQLSY